MPDAYPMSPVARALLGCLLEEGLDAHYIAWVQTPEMIIVRVNRIQFYLFLDITGLVSVRRLGTGPSELMIFFELNDPDSIEAICRELRRVY